MNINFKVDYDLQLDKIIDPLVGDAFGMFAATTVHSQYYQAMPYATGNFATNVKFEPFSYTHLASYAEEVYTTNKNYGTSVNTYAMANYIEGFKSVAMPKIEQSIGNYIRARIL